jgi:hypothetical protein
MFSRLKQLFQRGDREDRKSEEHEVHTREHDDAKARVEAEHYTHLHHGNLGGGNVGGFGGGS